MRPVRHNTSRGLGSVGWFRPKQNSYLVKSFNTDTFCGLFGGIVDKQRGEGQLGDVLGTLAQAPWILATHNWLRNMCMLSRVRLSMMPWTHGGVAHQAPLSLGLSGKNTGVGCHFLLQGIFLTQGSKQCLLCLLHCRQILRLLSHQRSPQPRGAGDGSRTTAWSAVGGRVYMSIMQYTMGETPFRSLAYNAESHSFHKDILCMNWCQTVVVEGAIWVTTFLISLSIWE